MNDNAIANRREKIGRRIAEERKRLGCSQTTLGEKLSAMMDGSISAEQNTISNWERGKNLPASLDVFLAMSQIFGCDCGYLLCDYDERTHNSSEICKATGLSDSSIQHLCSLQTWGVTEYAKAIDFLLLDAETRNVSHNYRSVLDLLLFFLHYDNAGAAKKVIFTDGQIGNYNDDGYIQTNAIALNNRIVENAALMELEQALISLKKLLREGKADNGKH